jgi:hypothetical protein
MDSFDILLLVIYGFICYAIGRASMMNSIVNAVINEAKEEKTQTDESNLEDLFVEKIDNMYYAYIGGQFVGQNSDLVELFRNMKSIYKVESFKVKNIDGLTKEDHRKIAEAIAKNYDLK